MMRTSATHHHLSSVVTSKLDPPKKVSNILPLSQTKNYVGHENWVLWRSRKTTAGGYFAGGESPLELPCHSHKTSKATALTRSPCRSSMKATWRLLCSSFLVMTSFLIGDHNILPQKELQRSLQVATSKLPT